ncbi:MAG: hypothetical protein JWN80_2253 [Microbacteriaceae bacterium]|nr:hypothetical protein [Microbacteriaceae bacterium]
MERMIRWVTAAVVVSALFATIYVVMQQAERQGADDAPIRVASQVASRLRAGDAATVDASDRIRLEDSESTFFVVYSAGDTPLAGSGTLAGKLAQVPSGVIDAARTTSHGPVTWEPRSGLRFAIDGTSVDGKVVVAGESLGPTERRIDQLGALILAAWAGTIVLLAIAFAADQGLVSAGRKRQSGRERS